MSRNQSIENQSIKQSKQIGISRIDSLNEDSIMTTNKNISVMSNMNLRVDNQSI